MSASASDMRIAAVVALTALFGCFTQSLAAEMQDDPRRAARADAGQTRGDSGGKSLISDAVRKLADAPGYHWTTTVTAGEPGAFGRGGGVTAGQTEKGGFTRVTMPAAGWTGVRNARRQDRGPDGRKLAGTDCPGRSRRGCTRAADRARPANDRRLQVAGRSCVGTRR